MKKIGLLFLVVAIFSCNSNNTVTQTTDSTDGVKTDTLDHVGEATASVYKCYIQILQRDTFLLHIQQHGDSISGRLSFDNYEKDSSSGFVTGKKQGDIIKLLYSFHSEGMNSVMEEYFKQSGSDLIRGTGNITNRGDSVFFLQPGKVEFKGGTFSLIDCDKVAAKYK